MAQSVSHITLNLILPLGISFYTFQSVGYLVDVYWGKEKADKNIFKVALFVSFFPQIIQGPISRHSELAKQFDEPHKFNYEQILSGFLLILWGLFKKLLIADVFATMVNIGFDKVSGLNGLQSVIVVLAYLIQDYADFSGCIDIAMGTAECFGIKLPQNFNRPYFSFTIPEYWRRWHMTLGTWFKDYIFYPISISKFSLKLGKFGKKCFGEKFGKQLPAIFGLAIVWLSTGIWHGASWNYILWGAYYGLIIIFGIVFKPVYTKIIEKLKINTKSWWYRTFQWIRTIWLLCVGRIIFRANSIADAWILFKNTFKFFKFDYTFASVSNLLITNSNILIVALVAFLILFAVDLFIELKPNINIRGELNNKKILQTFVVVGLAIVILLFGSYGPGFSAQDFVYMQF